MFKTIMISMALLAVPAAAHAEPTTEQRVVVIHDLDLTTKAGQRTLDQRLTEACGEASSFDLEGKNAVIACRADAQAKAVSNEAVRLARKNEAESASGQQ